MIKILALAKYGRQAASSRQRFFQFIDTFSENGVDLSISPFFDDEYLVSRLKNGVMKRGHVAKAIFRRLYAVLRADKYDVVIVHCDLIPYCPAWIEKLLLRKCVYVYDYDDAIFHLYDRHKSAFVRFFLGTKIRKLIERASAVMAGSKYLADYARQFNNRVALIPTVVDLAQNYVCKHHKLESTFTIGWIGSPSTTEYLREVFGALKELAFVENIRLVAIGAKPFQIEGVRVEIRPWAENTEIQYLMECDVGIMPLPDGSWEEGKCAFKLIQYMACCLPVIASPVGANNYVVRKECGLLAHKQEEWVSALLLLRDNPDLRNEMGKAGRSVVSAEYSKSYVAPKIVEIILAAYSQKRRREVVL